MNPLEDGTKIAIDWTKSHAVAASSTPVIPVVLQHAETGEVLFVGYANEEALRTTLSERIAVLWSTSRDELWRKGATSGDVLRLIDVRVNCEQNSLLYRVVPEQAGVCHVRNDVGETRPGCYYREVVDAATLRFTT